METIQWRNYQEEAIQAALSFYDEGKGRSVISIATGGGKTVVAGGLCQQFLHPSQHALIVVPFLDLVEQTAQKFERYFYPRRHIGVLQAQNNEVGRHITIASLSTILNPDRLDALLAATPRKFSLIVWDECHYGGILKAQRVIEQCLAPYGMLTGLSATPERTDGHSLLHLFPDDICYAKGLWDLIVEGYLADAKAIEVDFAPPPDGKGLSVERSQQFRLSKIYQEWCTHAYGKRTIVFAQDLADAYQFQEFLVAQGHTAQVITGKTPTATRQEAYAAFRAGTLTFLLNFGTLITGTDIEETECIIIMRKVESMGTLVQMVGRGTRLAPWIGKESFVLLDAAHNEISIGVIERLFGSTKPLVESVRQTIKEKQEEEARLSPEKPEKPRLLAQSVKADGQEFTLFATGWVLNPVKQQWSKTWIHDNQVEQFLVERAYDGGYLPLLVDAQGTRKELCTQYLSKLDAQRVCMHHIQQHEQGKEDQQNPEILDEPISDAQFAYLRQRKVPMRSQGVPMGRQMKAPEVAYIQSLMKKRDYYAIQARLKDWGSATSKTGRKIGYFEREGVKEWGGYH